MIVAFTPGGTTDFTARMIADKMQALLGQPIVVENKPGANGAIGAEYVAKADPDGYTLFFTTVGAVAINPALRSDLPYDPLKDFAPVGKAAVNSTILVVNADMKVNSARDLAELARAKARHHHHRHHRPRRDFRSRPAIVRGRRRHQVAGVPYRGAAPAMTDMLAGHLDGLFGDVPTVMAQVQAGKLKALAATSSERSDIFPGRADLRRTGFCRRGRRQLGRRAGAGRHAGAGHRQVQRRAWSRQ